MNLATATALCALLPALPAAQLHSAQDSQLATALEALDLQGGALQSLELPADGWAPFEVAIELAGTTQLVRFTPYSNRAADFQLYAQGEHGVLEQVDAPPPATYRGQVLGLPQSRVAGSLVDGQLSALIHLAEGEPLWMVQSLSEVSSDAPADLHVVYTEGDMLALDVACGLSSGPGLAQSESLPSAQGSSLKVCQVAFDADYEFYKLNDSSMNATVNDIEEVLNGVALIYQGGPNVIKVITTIIVRTTSSDPYTTSSPGGLLSQFKSHWNSNHNNVTRDVAHLMTGRDLDSSVIGVAQLNVICNTSQAYGLSQSLYSGSIGNRVALTAHEMGHNWSSSHCDGDSDCQLMCSGLGACFGIYKFGSYALNKIVNKKGNSGCLSNPAPPSLSGISPAQVQPLDDGFVALTGASLFGVNAMQVDGQFLPEEDFFLVDENTLKFVPPAPTALGSVTVQVGAEGSISNVLSLEYVPTAPPLILAGSGSPAGQPLSWVLAGGPGDVAFLVVAFTNTTVPVLGVDILALGLLINTQTLDGLGLGGLTVNIPPNAALGTVIYSQLLTLDGSLFLDASGLGFSVVTLL